MDMNDERKQLKSYVHVSTKLSGQDRRDAQLLVWCTVKWGIQPNFTGKFTSERKLVHLPYVCKFAHR